MRCAHNQLCRTLQGSYKPLELDKPTALCTAWQRGLIRQIPLSNPVEEAFRKKAAPLLVDQLTFEIDIQSHFSYNQLSLLGCAE